jgi:C-methyltransferase
MALVKGSPAYIGAFSKVTLNSVMWEQAGRLSEIVKAGHSLLEHDAETPDNPFWHDFQRASRQIAGMTGAVIADIAASLFPPAGPKRILDIACGSGLYGFSMLKRFEDARLVSMDWPGVLELTRPIAEQMGLSNRVEFRPGDIFKDELGSGYDLIIAANIYHHFNPDKNRKLSRRLFEAAAPGAILIIVDMIPDENREKANFQLTFALTMLIWTQEGDTYTLSEYERMLAPVGWRDIMLKEVPGGPRVTQAVIARKSTGT